MIKNINKTTNHRATQKACISKPVSCRESFASVTVEILTVNTRHMYNQAAAVF